MEAVRLLFCGNHTSAKIVRTKNPGETIHYNTAELNQPTSLQNGVTWPNNINGWSRKGKQILQNRYLFGYKKQNQTNE